MSPKISNFLNERRVYPLPPMNNSDPKPDEKTKASYTFESNFARQAKKQNKNTDMQSIGANGRRHSSSEFRASIAKVSFEASSKTNPTHRRAIFSTLYESKSQTSPLCRNQVRVGVSKTSIPSNANTTRVSSNEQSSLKHPISQDPHHLSSSKRTKQIDCDCPVVHATADDDASTISNTTAISARVLIAECTTKTNNVTIDETHDNSTETFACNSRNPDAESSVQSSSDNMTINAPIILDDPIHESKQYSPTSTANDIHKKILPGPSILKNRLSQIHQKTPAAMGVMTPDTANALARTSSLSAKKLLPTFIQPQLPDTDFPSPPSLPSDEPKNVASHSVTIAAPNDKWSLPSLRKSLSDSCIDSLQCLSISEDSDDSSVPSHTTIVGEGSNFVRSGKVCDRVECGCQSSILITRHISHEEMITPKRKIRFDPRVWVHEIQKPELGEIWYTPSELEHFKSEAVMRIREWASKHQRRYSISSDMIGTGTGRIISTSSFRMDRDHRYASKAIFTNPALTLDSEDDEEMNALETRNRRNDLVKKELKKILIVDSHDIFLKLLSKGIKVMIPAVEITTAYTAVEALEKMEAARKEDPTYSHGFDMLIIEERLKRRSQLQMGKDINFLNLITPSSGSSLIQRIASDTKKLSEKSLSTRVPLVVGISAYIDNDEQKLRQSGSDFVWGKPPPKMNEDLRDKILLAVQHKRGRISKGIFNHGT